MAAILEGKIDGRRRIKRKKKSCMRNIKEWTKNDGETLIHVAQIETILS